MQNETSPNPTMNIPQPPEPMQNETNPFKKAKAELDALMAETDAMIAYLRQPIKRKPSRWQKLVDLITATVTGR